jgi:hypothetical protein
MRVRTAPVVVATIATLVVAGALASVAMATAMTRSTYSRTAAARAWSRSIPAARRVLGS